MRRIVDAHQHRWRLDAPWTQWPTRDLAAIHADALRPQAVAAMGTAPVTAIVLVQAQPDPAETDWLLSLAEDEPVVRGVVGWVDFADPAARTRIATLARNPRLKGLRPMLQSIADPDWLLRPEQALALAAMADHGLRLDALVQPRHLPMLTRFASRWPQIPLVIDHGAKPVTTAAALPEWQAAIARLADLGLWAKLSGLRTEQPPGAPAAALAPWVDHLVARFGDRLIWGSDWPVVRLAGDDWGDWLADAAMLAADADADRLFAGAATEFYDLTH